MKTYILLDLIECLLGKKKMAVTISNRGPITIPKPKYGSHTVNLGGKLVSNRVPKHVTHFGSSPTGTQR